ncbi:MAG TPA: hypothetical protein VKR61_02810 [Bryobacteraceae bacterium]|nr:hypothetical protein [Bryobacteraceae bacterium]
MRVDQAGGQELEWRQPEALRKSYQLTGDGGELATLRFESAFGSLAAGECGAGKWTFKRSGFLSPKVTVRPAGLESSLAVFTPGWMGNGWVVFSWGRRYHLKHTSFWGTEWVFEAEDGTPVVTLSAKTGFLKQGGISTVAPSAAGLQEAPILLLLIWYVRVLMNEDDAAAVVAATG